MKKISKWIDKKLEYFFTVPTIVFVLVMVLFPLIYTFLLSFNKWRLSANVSWSFVGLKNYIKLFSTSRFPNSVFRTFYFTFIALFFEMLLGIAIAVLLNRDFKGKNFVKTAFIIPMVATPVAISLVWRLMYEPTIGVFNYIIKLFGGNTVDFLGSTKVAIYSLLAIEIWQGTPIVILLVLAGLSSIPQDPIQAAKVDGANRFQIFTKITIPLLKPVIFTALMLRLIDVLKTFDVVYSLTQGGPAYSTETMNVLAYRQAFDFLEFGQASSTLVMFVLIVMVMALIAVKIKNRAEEDLYD